jgi:pimeloyl-ACP methyl ester carboxylesterase
MSRQAPILAMLDFQTRLIFPVGAVPRAGPLPAGAQELTVRTGDGGTLRGVHIPAERRAKERLLVLGFGGNGWNGQDVGEFLHDLFPAADVVAFHYRGYPPSTGEPSAHALIADAPLVFDHAVERVKPSRIIAVGFSIGSGVAATLAAQRDLDGLVLVTPFDSLKAVAQALYPWVPIGRFFALEIDAAGALADAYLPVAILGAERDEIVPPERTKALRACVTKLVFDRTMAHAGHNDIYARSDFHQAMREAMAVLIRSG